MRTGIEVNNAPDNTIGGKTPLTRNVISGNENGITLTGINATTNIIVNNYIGTNAAGTFGLPIRTTFASGLYIQQGAARTHIGGTAPADRNVISGNAMNGAATYYEATDNALIQNNIIGKHPRYL